MEASSNQTAQSLVELALAEGALKLGDFTLKSGRSSPYFVDFGALCQAAAAIQLAELYADALADAGIPVATLFGAAYKGIPLAALVAAALSRRPAYASVRFAYGRKEKKQHGEGGSLVGKIESPVVVVDDVVTAGTAADQAIAELKEARADVIAMIVAFDRLERAEDAVQGTPAALESLGAKHGIRTLSLATAADMADVLDSRSEAEGAARILQHLAEHGGVRISGSLFDHESPDFDRVAVSESDGEAGGAARSRQHLPAHGDVSTSGSLFAHESPDSDRAAVSESRGETEGAARSRQHLAAHGGVSTSG